ncbi:cupin domain-containing protein [Brevibacillus laterosporus]|uniref:Cupin domain-containing protein n=1 Tax=Brevibacillus laterosporus TaxID=1465 RepID=A0AAP8U5Y4_BRELA|nr:MULTISPECIES: cupin domain-containing protein [Brevibacillus]ATO51639.1 ethanolamine utilization protein [Brevibacillus laterosporus DSM 25]MBG9775678.1 ethanolamine utilization protein [Brevibacillus laterosporus]MBG9790305.1 ethanolamine utilization protein [Brevibacillus laterosporus]MBG9803935.1 ethanolamine utilization protein [Brevibacillus laterosporus]MCR8937011.1 cupin domain-containing protein [Brevibacillus laterosporus]
MQPDTATLEALVRKIVLEKLKQLNKSPDVVEKNIDPSGVMSVKVNTMKLEPFDTGKTGDRVYLKDALHLQESPRLGCGLMEMKETTFDWTLKYDEIDYIIEGTLEIVINGRRIIGNAGDIILIPKNTSIQFSVPTYAKFLYVTYPANWQELD